MHNCRAVTVYPVPCVNNNNPMSKSLVKISSNWPQSGGCEFPQAVQLQAADPDIFIRPLLDDIVNEEKSILFSKADIEQYCELSIQLYPHYKIQAISLVCNVPKIEIFQGPLKEYLETIYGIIVDEADEQFKTYRYDVEVERSGIVDLTVKFLTHSSDVCIFGIMLHTAPNPNGITTLLPAGSINIENVQSILQNSSKNLLPASEKCKQFLELIASTKTRPTQTSQTKCNEIVSNFAASNSEQFVKTCHVIHPNKMNVNGCNASQDENHIVNSLKIYINKRFQEMEERLNKRLEIAEERQIKKLDNILRILEKNP